MGYPAPVVVPSVYHRPLSLNRGGEVWCPEDGHKPAEQDKARAALAKAGLKLGPYAARYGKSTLKGVRFDG